MSSTTLSDLALGDGARAASVEQIQALLDVLPVATVALLPGGESPTMNRSCTELFGLDLPGAWERSWFDVVHPDSLSVAWHAIQDAAPGETVGPFDMRLEHGDGSWVDCATTIRFDQGLGWFLIQVMDIRDRRRVRQSLLEAARTDALTGVANRAGLMHELEQRCDDTAPTLVAAFDLDRFKRINDTFGHAVGDEVLTVVARRLHSQLGDAGLVARIGGDEFVVIAPAGETDAAGFGAAIAATVSERIAVGGRHVAVGCSIGLALSDGTIGATELLHHADYASYVAKAQPGSAWTIADTELIDERRRAAQLEFELRNAVWTGQFVPWFQPIVRLRDGATLGHEALLRWKRSDGWIAPAASFLRQASDIGMMSSIGREIVFRTLALASAVDLGVIGINVSGAELADPDWAAEVARHADACHVDCARIRLEVSEAVVTDDLALAVEGLERLAAHGFQIALDDFGALHAPLMQLAELPVTAVKLDPKLLRGRSSSMAAQRMFEFSVDLVGELGLDLVVEGVESAADHDYLRRLGVEAGQGWFFGRAAPLGSLAES